MSQLVYIDTNMSDHAVRKYRGAVARNYNAKRQESPKWKAEQEILESWIKELADNGSGKFLDIPTGTGRLLPCLVNNGMHGFALDISEDMLSEAKEADPLKGGGKVYFAKGDVRDLSAVENDFFDVAFMIRLTRWLSPQDRDKALRELQRVASKAIVFTARVNNHKFAYPYKDIKKSLCNWEMTRDYPAGDPDYRIIMLEPVK